MTVSSNQAAPLPSTWHLESFEDLAFLDADISGYRHNQGIAWNADAGEWIASWNFGLARETEDFKFLQTTGSFDFATRLTTTGIPQELADLGYDHIGDIDYYNGVIYASLDSKVHGYQDGQVALFNATDLSYMGVVHPIVGAPSNPHNDVASWVAVDGANGVGYGKEWQSGNTINVYNLDDWSFKGTLEMDMSLDRIQGAKLFNGKLYMSANDEFNSVYSVELSTGHVEKLFDLPPTDNASYETEGIALRLLADGSVEMIVEMVVNPIGDSNVDSYARLFRYVNGEATGDAPDLSHTFIINNTSDIVDPDNFSVSLREAIAKANEGDTITFDAALKGQTISLSDAELVLSKNITINGDIDGDGKSDITISTSGTSAAFHVTGGTAILNGLLVTNSEEGNSSVVVDDGATLNFTNGATSNSQTEGDDVLTGAGGFDAIRGGGGDDVIQGVRGNDLLYGDAGNDLLIGGAGGDTMVGGAGDDTYIVTDEGDVVTELAGEGTDTVKVTFSYTLGGNVENLTLMGTSDLDGTGNGLANVLTGNGGANMLSGLSGNDRLMGWAGDDTLDGGIGADTLGGGKGADILIGGAGKDALYGGAGADRFVFAFGDTAASKSRADTIFDMQGNKGDLIDLHLIDAKDNKAGDQAFGFIGTDAFSGHAGELRYEKAGGETYIYGDTDGDKKMDFAIHLDDAMTLKADYFAL